MASLMQSLMQSGEPFQNDPSCDTRCHERLKSNSLTPYPLPTCSRSSTADCHLSVSNASGNYDGLASIGEVLNRPPLTSERHPVIRTGERKPIPWHVRSAVWYRDHGRCEFCQARAGDKWELDHIIPWSAGGSDDTTNLRVLCVQHNQDRSNFASHDDVRPRMAATWWCDRCYGLDVKPWFYSAEDRYIECPVHRSRKVCNVMRNYEWGNKQETWEPWHRRQQVLEPTLTAFCAHCGMPGVTDVVL